MRTIPFLIVILCTLVLAMDAYGAPTPQDSPTKGSTAAAQCMEDEPCWKWSRMGNRKRGVVLDGRLVIVGRCRFARLVFNDRLKFGNGETETTQLPGDGYALKFAARGGCCHA
jgi:hypothetical protein